jgi:CheY-like chemotaxis protein
VGARPILLIHDFAISKRVVHPLERRLPSPLGRPVVRVPLGGRIPLHLQDVRESARLDESPVRAVRRPVLVVDDAPTPCELLEAILGDNGFGALSVRDVDSALSVLARFELVRAVAMHERRAPVVLMSSFSGERAAVQAREAGAAEFVRRPSPPSQLVRSLDRAMSTREAA